MCTGVLPKSVNPKHIEENAQIFDFQLSADHMSRLSGINSDVHYCWDPSSVLWYVTVSTFVPSIFVCKIMRFWGVWTASCSHSACQHYFSKHCWWNFMKFSKKKGLLGVVDADLHTTGSTPYLHHFQFLKDFQSFRTFLSNTDNTLYSVCQNMQTVVTIKWLLVPDDIFFNVIIFLAELCLNNPWNWHGCGGPMLCQSYITLEWVPTSLWNPTCNVTLCYFSFFLLHVY